MKECIKCKSLKGDEEFPFYDKPRGLRKNSCKACQSEYYVKYKAENPERLRTSWNNASKKYYDSERRRNKTLRAYGLTEDAYNEMFDAQSGCCKVCNKAVALVVDHDHSTGKVRALLCNACNLGLGCFYENLDTMAAAMLYLSEHSGREVGESHGVS